MIYLSTDLLVYILICLLIHLSIWHRIECNIFTFTIHDLSFPIRRRTSEPDALFSQGRPRALWGNREINKTSENFQLHTGDGRQGRTVPLASPGPNLIYCNPHSPHPDAIFLRLSLPILTLSILPSLQCILPFTDSLQTTPDAVPLPTPSSSPNYSISPFIFSSSSTPFPLLPSPFPSFLSPNLLPPPSPLSIAKTENLSTSSIFPEVLKQDLLARLFLLEYPIPVWHRSGS